MHWKLDGRSGGGCGCGARLAAMSRVAGGLLSCPGLAVPPSVAAATVEKQIRLVGCGLACDKYGGQWVEVV
jgi:hypothetical protein